MKARQRIYQSIERQIAEEQLLPGDPVDEETLMEHFGVSRTPVREALLQLQAEGLLTSLPRGGVVVAKMSVSQLFAMWELLAELEGLCARYACERMLDEERQALQAIHEASDEIVRRDDQTAWQEANMRFHECLYAAARNPYLRQEILRMRVRTQAYRKHAFGAIGRLQVSHRAHGEIVKAISANNSAAAAKAAFRHMSPGHGAPGVKDLIMNLPRDLLAAS